MEIFGILWFILKVLMSNISDVISKFLSYDVSIASIVFWRNFFSTISLIPILFYQKNYSKLIPNNPLVQLFRGIIFFVAIYIWIFALNTTKTATSTSITFTIPIFMMILAPIFLNEHVGKKLWISTIVIFISVIFALDPFNDEFNPLSLLLILSALLFAILDTINKKYIHNENMVVMLLYSSLISTVLSFFFVDEISLPSSYKELILLALLGIAGNLILYCLLRALRLINASKLSPVRYVELIFGGISGYLIFQEVPSIKAFLSYIVIIAGTFYINSNR